MLFHNILVNVPIIIEYKNTILYEHGLQSSEDGLLDPLKTQFFYILLYTYIPKKQYRNIPATKYALFCVSSLQKKIMQH